MWSVDALLLMCNYTEKYLKHLLPSHLRKEAGVEI